MNNPTKNPTTRASLTATAAYNTRWFASLLAGSAVLGTAFATDWVGDTSGDWNDNLNWLGDAGNTGNAVINSLGGGNPPYTATISTNATQPVVDIFVGINAGQTGLLNHTSGTAATGSGGNWMEVGTNGGTGTYNLTGSGTMNVAGRLYVGGSDGGGRTAAGSTGTVTVNTSGSLTTGSDLVVGEFDGTGTFNLQSGTVTTGGWNFCGRRAGSEGYWNISGGTLTNSGRFYIGENAKGVVTQTGGTITNGGEVRIGQGTGGDATLNLSAGTFTANGWCIIGREGSNGTLNLSGTGNFVKNSGDPFAISNDGGVGSGTINQTGGTLTTASGSAMRIGGSGTPGASGVWNMSGGTATIGGQIRIGSDGPGTLTFTGGTINAPATVTAGASSTGTFNLNGGTLVTNQINGGTGVDTTTFNGTQIVVSAPLTPFIGGLDNPTIGTNGLLVDTNGANATVTQAFTGPGGLVKSGAGTLTLSGASDYAGDNTVNGGSLVLSTDAIGTGAITAANGTTLGVNATSPTGQLTSSAVTLGNSTVSFGRGDLVGVNPTVAPLNVTGTLAVNGAVNVSVSGARFAVGDIPLIAYTARSGAGTINPVPASLPSGVVASIVVDDNYFGAGLGAVYLDVTSVALPKWTGNLVNRFTTGSPSTLSNDVIVANATGIAIGNTVTGPGIDVGTTVTAIAGNTVTLSLTPTADGTDVNLMFSAGPGANPGVWDTTTANWVDQVTGSNSVYADPNPALFDDDAPGSTAVVLNSTVNPSNATFNNSTLTYSLSGTGSIGGAGSLVKQGTGDLTISTVNTYDGATRLEGGTLTVGTIEDLGTPSPIGDNSNLVIAGGILNYTGAADTTTRGLTLDAPNGGINNAANLTFSGQVLNTGTGSNLRKQGAGDLIFTFGGTNTFSSLNQPVDVEAGTLILDGTAGGQVNTVNGEMWVGSEPNVPATLNVTNSTLNVSSWLAIARGNGDDGVTNVNFTNSTVQTGNFSAGWNNGLGANASESFVNVTGSTWNSAGTMHIAESSDSTTTVTLTNSALTHTGFADFADSTNTTATLSLINSTWFSNNDATELSAGADSVSNVTISGTSEMRVDRLLLGIGTDSVANIVVENSGKLTKTGGSWMSIGNSNNGQGSITVRDSGTLSLTGSELNIADVGTSSGTLTLEDNATFTNVGALLLAKNSGTSAALNISGNATITSSGSWLAGGNEGQNNTPVATITQTGGSITLNGDDNRTGGTGTAVWNISAGSVTSNGWMTLGRYVGGTGTMNVSGGTVTQNHANRPFRIAEFGTGILNVSGTAVVSAPNAGGFQMGGGTTGVGTINLDGGTLIANRIHAGGNDAFQTVSLDGGTLQAATGANLNFIAAQIGTLSLDANNADIDSTIDTNGQTVAINKTISDGGGNLIKSGAGTLQLNGFNSYLGTTTVTAGTLGGNGSLDGPLQIDAAASINPGTSAGTFSAFDSVNLDGTYVCEIDGAVADQLAVGGTLTIAAGAKLDFNALSAPTAPVYVIATYGTLSGTFAPANVTDVPAGYTLDYNYLAANQIALVQTATPYSTWASSFGLDPNGDGAPGVDKDGDGQLNSVEFALGGSPISGSDNAKIYSIGADSDFDSPDTLKELLLTIAVRTGTGNFTGATSKSAVSDDPTYGYTVEGSLNLTAFGETVNVVPTAVPPAGVTLPAGYTWKTFSLQGSNGVPSKGFLRVLVTP